MAGLHLGTTGNGEAFNLPVDALTSMTAIIGRRGSGKTTTALVMTEEFIAAGLPVVLLDPLGVHWGLRSSADGEGVGLPVTIIGGQHGDVPLDEHAGHIVADLVIEHPGAYIIDISGFESRAAERRFSGDFAEHLYRRKDKDRTALGLIVDEADTFAPQRTGPEEARMLGAFEAIARRGRSRGLGMVVITQRPAVLNKNVMSQTELMVAHQITSPHDRKALQEWAEGNATPEQVRTFIESLASLQVGEAWIWSPAWLQVFERVKVRRRRTFDSSATPKAGETRIEPKVLADVDIDVLRVAMSEAIEKAEAEDPKVLRRRIKDLEAQLQNGTQNIPPVCDHEAELAALRSNEANLAEAVDHRTEKLRALFYRIKSVEGGVLVLGSEVAALLAEVEPFTANTSPAPAAPVAVEQLPPPRGQATKSVTWPSNGVAPGQPAGAGMLSQARTLGKAERAILTALAQHYVEGLTRQPLAILTGYAYSGGFRNTLSALRTAGYLAGDNQSVMHITEGGVAALGQFEPLPTGRELLNYWLADKRLGKAEKAVLQQLHGIYPASMSGPDVAQAAGYEYSGGFRNALSKLRTLGLVQGSNAGMKASEVFFS